MGEERSMMGLERIISRMIPEGKLKNHLKKWYLFYFRHTPKFWRKIVEKILALEITKAGVTRDKMSYFKLKNGLTFFSFLSKKGGFESFLYRRYQSELGKKFSEEVMQVAVDFIMRYDDPGLKGDEKEKYYQVKKGDRVLELGAYIGFYTVKLAQKVGKSGKVIAVEPVQSNLKILRKNIQANGLDNVIIVPKGAWNIKEEKIILVSGYGQDSVFQDVLVTRQVKKEKILLDTVDNILQNNGIKKIDFITLEINGAEIEAIKGMKKTLKNPEICLAVSCKYKRTDGGDYPCQKVIPILKRQSFKTVEENLTVYASKNF